MTGVVLTEFTKKVNLRHFFEPREVVPRTMTATMADFDWDDNPVIDDFSSRSARKPVNPHIQADFTNAPRIVSIQ